MIFARLFLFVLLFMVVVVCPWWATVAFLVISLFMFKGYYEAIFFALVIDLLYGVPVFVADGNIIYILTHSLLFTVIFIVLFFSIEELKKSLLLYK